MTDKASATKVSRAKKLQNDKKEQLNAAINKAVAEHKRAGTQNPKLKTGIRHSKSELPALQQKLPQLVKQMAKMQTLNKPHQKKPENRQLEKLQSLPKWFQK